MTHRSFRTRLVLSFAIIHGALSLFSLLFWPARLTSSAREWFEARALGVAEVVIHNAEAAIDFDDRVSTTRLLENLSRHGDALDGVIYLANGETFASFQRKGDAADTNGRAGAAVSPEHLRVSVPFSTRGGQRGTFVANFDLSELNAETVRAQETGLSVALSILLLGLLITYFSATFLVAPLERLTALAHRIAAGETSAREQLNLTRGDEIGALARALHAMVDELMAVNHSLEKRVSVRTQELAEANKELEARLHQLHNTREQLIVADRRLSVGQLAAGVAHEINNPLAYIMANIDFVRGNIRKAIDADTRGGASMTALGYESSNREHQVPVDLPEDFAALDQAYEGCQRVATIVSGLKTFSRADDNLLEPIDIKKPLEAAINMAWNELRHRAELVRELDDVPMVHGSATRLAQVFLNLLINAGHAVEASGSHGTITVRLWREGQRVCLSITDTGCGFGPDVQARLFTPFFTTKSVGKGTGLGLSICQNIVSGLGGTIHAEGKPGVGATFTIRLGIADEALAPVHPLRRENPLRPGLRMLVVDDDPRILSSLTRLLRHEVQVVTAEGGAAGLRTLAADRDFDAVLCDLMMPEVTGMEFYDALDELDPRVAERTLFMSGGAFTEVAVKFVETHRDRVLEKPIAIDALRARIHALAKLRGGLTLADPSHLEKEASS